ncbi:Dihydrofolate reductase [Corynebacterium capitovis DSM 44611]|uniref:dihydrofolate reductase n=1 Tax=Corynebacterium capitovis TaxID=131081 RepID=UPI00037538DF|nr:dihydrofolate reductase [Corynebacterium capitovis]WKD58061.1 Dihydrofolate reductase [Corynebacterium capitovis DSM 44611]
MKGAIWAQSLDGVIGDGTSLPWHLPEDLKHFKTITLGSPIVMGRRTWESLTLRPLPGRENIIISSREPGEWSAGAHVAHEFPPLEDAWIIGGAQLFSATLPLVDRIERTLIDVHLAPDLGARAVILPDVPPEFTLVDQSRWETSASGLRYSFQRFERIS